MPEGPTKPTMFCRNCGYALDGLGAGRCPDCGRKFDPNKPSSYGDRPPRPAYEFSHRFLASPWFVIPGMWATALFPLAFILTVPLLVCGFVASIWRKRYIAAALVLVLSPFGFAYISATIGYMRGTAYLEGMGYPSMSSGNVDPVLRCERLSGGCVIHGNEFIFLLPYNFQLEFLINTFGPMPGSYTGPYPTEQQAFAALANAKPIPLDQLLQDQVILPSASYNLDKDVGTKLIMRTEWGYSSTSPSEVSRLVNEMGPITAALTQGTCLILRVPTDYLNPPSAMIVVIDTQTGRPFAYYPEGKYSHAFPPVRWRE